jgi:hypothetical protein
MFQQQPKQHPLHNFRKKSDLIIICDDTEDWPSETQVSPYIDPHYQWHFLVIPVWCFNAISDGWNNLKESYGVPNGYMHAAEVSNLLRGDKRINYEINDLLFQYDVRHFITRVTRQESKHYLSIIKNFPHYPEIRENWSLQDPKEQSLYLNLVVLDHEMPNIYYKPEGYAFCDSTQRSDSSFRQFKDKGHGWGSRTHGYLDNIDNNICFKINSRPSDEIGFCLDLPDYLAWSTQRVTRMISARDFGRGRRNLTDGVWKRRLKKLHENDRTLCELFLQRVTSGKSKYLWFYQMNTEGKKRVSKGKEKARGVSTASRRL